MADIVSQPGGQVATKFVNEGISNKNLRLVLFSVTLTSRSEVKFSENFVNVITRRRHFLN